jgi:hypothetical protein
MSDKPAFAQSKIEELRAGFRVSRCKLASKDQPRESRMDSREPAGVSAQVADDLEAAS